MSLLTCRKIAVLDSIILTLQLRRAHFTSSEKASSVPGRMHTAVVGSSGAANPRVPVLKLTVLSLSPTLAGRDLTWWRLKSHMGRGTPQTSRSPRPFLLPEPAQNSNLATRRCGNRAARWGIASAQPAIASRRFGRFEAGEAPFGE